LNQAARPPVRQRGSVTVTTYSELRGRNTYPLYKTRLSCPPPPPPPPPPTPPPTPPPPPPPKTRIPRIYTAMVYCQNDFSLCTRTPFCCMPETTFQQECRLNPRTMYICMCPQLNVSCSAVFLYLIVLNRLVWLIDFLNYWICGMLNKASS